MIVVELVVAVVVLVVRCLLFLRDIRFLRTMVLFYSLLCSAASLFHFAPSKRKTGYQKFELAMSQKNFVHA